MQAFGPSKGPSALFLGQYDFFIEYIKYLLVSVSLTASVPIPCKISEKSHVQILRLNDTILGGHIGGLNTKGFKKLIFNLVILLL